MRRAFGFQQQSYGMRQEAQQQSHLMHQEAAWHSKDDYNSLEIGLQTVPSLCLDSQLMKHTSLFDGNQALQFHNSSWDDHILNQNGWSSSGTNGTFYNHPSGAIKLLPVMDVTNTADFSRGAMFNKSMENAEYRTRFHEEMHVPATVRVHGMRYESSVWGDHDILHYRRHPLYDVKGRLISCRQTLFELCKGACYLCFVVTLFLPTY